MKHNRDTTYSKPIFRLILVVCVLTLSACSSLTQLSNLGFSNSSSSDETWLQSGSLVIARNVPQPSNQTAHNYAANQAVPHQAVPHQAAPNQATPSKATHNLMGFMPQTVEVQPAAYSLRLDRTSRTGVIFHGSVKLENFSLKDITGLEPGEYRIIHKQRHPVWYAPDQYYINRGLDIPAADDRSRYLKGALGDFVIYLDEQSPIHNAQVWSDDVGGVRISDNNIAKMYYQLEIGSRVTIN